MPAVNFRSTPGHVCPNGIFADCFATQASHIASSLDGRRRLLAAGSAAAAGAHRLGMFTPANVHTAAAAGAGAAAAEKAN
jgi:hypothetical protein